MKERIISAAVAIILFIPITIIGGLPITILAYLMASIGLYELLRMRNIAIFSFPGYISLLCLWVLLFPQSYVEMIGGLPKLEIAIAGIFLLLSYTVFVKNRFTFDDVGFIVITILYVGIGFYYFIEIREIGLVYLYFVLFVIWGTDSGAYFIGKSIGKRKLWPEISPNKTIAGSVGGIVSAAVIAIIFFIFSNINIPLAKLLIAAIFMSAFGQMGDLVQSAFKRHYNVKDSGNIMPGHGGILDRCDSWLFALPLFYIIYII